MKATASPKRSAALLGLLIVWSLILCGPALAHAGIVEASPEYDETVSRPPEQVRVRFNERVEAVFDPVKVYAPEGDRVDKGDARTDPNDPTTVVTSLEEGLPAGTYEVRWRATSADGHPIDGEYQFVAQEGGAADGPAEAPPQAEQRSDSSARGAPDSSWPTAPRASVSRRRW